MDGKLAFSPDYWSARDRFRSAAIARRFRLETHPIDESADLTVDVALVGDEHPKRLVVVSSGLHGVEGFVGSAIQNAVLEADERVWSVPEGSGLILIHALDPFGYANLRRFDAANVDLNRNFILDGDTFSGSPETYREIDWLINPTRPPAWVDFLKIESIPALLRHGELALRRAIAGGQFDFPEGLFFGGHGPSSVRRMLEVQLPKWVGEAEYILHLDFHTGLGRWKNLALLLEDTVIPDRARWLADRFGEERVEKWGEEISYPTRGGLGTWCQSRFDDRIYDFLCAEFGTYSGLAVLGSLRAENQAYHWGRPDSWSTRRAKRRIVEAFAPSDPGWRRSTVEQGLFTLRKAFEIAFHSSIVV